MLVETFIENINNSYNGKLKDVDAEEITQFIHDNELTTEQIQNWYNVIKRKHQVQYTPVFGQLMNYWEEARHIRTGNNLLHSESSLQMLYKYKDKSAKWLIQKCAEIRKVQEKRELYNKEISFLVIWERLKNIVEHKQEEAKQRIIDNGDQEIYKPLDLSDIEIPWEPVKLTQQRTEETKSLQRKYF